MKEDTQECGKRKRSGGHEGFHTGCLVPDTEGWGDMSEMSQIALQVRVVLCQTLTDHEQYFSHGNVFELQLETLYGHLCAEIVEGMPRRKYATRS